MDLMLRNVGSGLSQPNDLGQDRGVCHRTLLQPTARVKPMSRYVEESMTVHEIVGIEVIQVQSQGRILGRFKSHVPL